MRGWKRRDFYPNGTLHPKSNKAYPGYHRDQLLQFLLSTTLLRISDFCVFSKKYLRDTLGFCGDNSGPSEDVRWFTCDDIPSTRWWWFSVCVCVSSNVHYPLIIPKPLNPKPQTLEPLNPKPFSYPPRLLKVPKYLNMLTCRDWPP